MNVKQKLWVRELPLLTTVVRKTIRRKLALAPSAQVALATWAL